MCPVLQLLQLTVHGHGPSWLFTLHTYHDDEAASAMEHEFMSHLQVKIYPKVNCHLDRHTWSYSSYRQCMDHRCRNFLGCCPISSQLQVFGLIGSLSSCCANKVRWEERFAKSPPSTCPFLLLKTTFCVNSYLDSLIIYFH